MPLLDSMDIGFNPLDSCVLSVLHRHLCTFVHPWARALPDTGKEMQGFQGARKRKPKQ